MTPINKDLMSDVRLGRVSVERLLDDPEAYDAAIACVLLHRLCATEEAPLSELNRIESFFQNRDHVHTLLRCATRGWLMSWPEDTANPVFWDPSFDVPSH